MEIIDDKDAEKCAEALNHINKYTMRQRTSEKGLRYYQNLNKEYLLGHLKNPDKISMMNCLYLHKMNFDKDDFTANELASCEAENRNLKPYEFIDILIEEGYLEDNPDFDEKIHEEVLGVIKD